MEEMQLCESLRPRTKCLTASAGPRSMAGSFRCTIRATLKVGRHLAFLRRYNVFEPRLHLNRRKTRCIPAAAESLDEEHTRHQPLAVNHGEFLLIVEQILLSVDDIQVIHEATGVAAAGDVQRAPRSLDRLLL